jgi:peptidoglycan/LPS O-acetylase OafA/YrhL
LEERAALGAQTRGWALFVDLFFILSGFIISALYRDRMTGPRDYARFLQSGSVG